MKKPESFLAKFPSPITFKLAFFLTSLNILDVDLTRGKKINSGDGAVADGDLTLACVYVDSGEVIEVVEECSVRCTQSELDLGELGENTEESHLSLCHCHLSEDSCLSLACEHFYYYLNYYNILIYITTY